MKKTLEHLINRKITKVGENWIQLEDGCVIYLAEDEVEFLAEYPIKEYRVILTTKSQQVKIVTASSREEAVDLATADDWKEKEDVIETYVEAYLNDFKPNKQ